MTRAPTELAPRIEARATAIAAASVEERYRDPFWVERFGADGRRLAGDDEVDLVAMLAESLHFGAPEPLVRYVRMVRGAMVARGMCSRHLSEQLARIGTFCCDAGIEDPGPIPAYLEQARKALRRPVGAAALIDEVEDALADDVASSLASTRAAWSVWSDPEGWPRVRHDAALLVSYLADALAEQRSEIFLEHAAWTAGFFARQGRPDGYAEALLAALDHEVEELPALARIEAARLVARARLDRTLQAARGTGVH
ncbi:MAG TPA: hypothetical protein VMM18_03970 [Gemmatimonadaceae bacterium]|nr:hypothetical protein [Gemmatimonadaceae bacterium]